MTSSGVVAAAVEDHDHLVAAGGHVALGGERVQAGGDPRLLVAGGYDDDRLERRGAAARARRAAGARRGGLRSRFMVRSPGGDQLAAPLVVLVAVVGEHADELVVAGVPDGERAVGMLLEAASCRGRRPRRRT